MQLMLAKDVPPGTFVYVLNTDTNKTMYGCKTHDNWEWETKDEYQQYSVLFVDLKDGYCIGCLPEETVGIIPDEPHAIVDLFTVLNTN